RLLLYALRRQIKRGVDQRLQVSSLRMGGEVVDDPCALATARVTPFGVEALAALTDQAVEHVPEVTRRHRLVLRRGAETGVSNGGRQLFGERAARRLDHLRQRVAAEQQRSDGQHHCRERSLAFKYGSHKLSSQVSRCWSHRPVAGRSR